MASRVTAHRLAVTVLWLAAGCGGTDRRPLAGSVTLDDKPLATGLIQFEPAEGDGLATGAVIAAGRYEIPANRGLPPGRYRVRIQAVDEATPPPPGAAPGDAFLPPGKDLIPARYNAATELSVEITPSGRSVHDFHLTRD